MKKKTQSVKIDPVITLVIQRNPQTQEFTLISIGPKPPYPVLHDLLDTAQRALIEQERKALSEDSKTK